MNNTGVTSCGVLLAVLQQGHLVFDLVELSGHPAVLLVHLDTLSPRPTGGNWLREVKHVELVQIHFKLLR